MSMTRVVYAWGSGGAGQLGTRTDLDYSAAFDEIIPGGCHTAGRTSRGELYTWGDGTHGQPGDGSNASAQLEPQIVRNIPQVERASCGWWHTVVVAKSDDSDRSSQVLAWGHGHESKPAILLTFPPSMHVTSIACGWKHSLLATQDGQVYSWGRGRHGELALGSSVKDAKVPTLVESAPPTKIVFCGWQHSVFLDTSGHVWTCGSNKHGQLGQNTSGNSFTLERVVFPQDNERAAVVSVRSMSVGWHHAVCIAEDGSVHAWGKGDLGQLGLGEFASESIPRKANFLLDEVVQVACGSEHTLLVSASGQVYSCGWGEHGNLGHNHTSNLNRPTRIDFFETHAIKISFCLAAGATSFAISTAAS
ncbi:hypothetical protein AC1031_001754 [Aphanomyces cochlioides]|nr:hypothetical protein AC1031_001754 [Aphanomyces cochlioides]